MRRIWAKTVVFALLALCVPAAASADQVVRFSIYAGTQPFGNIDVRLLAADAPNTVANFLSYVNSGAYTNTVIHRSVTNFVIQGGGFTFDGTTNTFVPIAQQPAIANEFKDSNVRGTIAMALTSTNGTQNPDSATDQWFFNTVDNSGSLDPQKFTVFGKVIDDPSLAVMDAVANEPTTSVTTPPLGSQSAPNPLPLVSAAPGITAGNLFYVHSITVLNYAAPTVTISKPADNSVFKSGQTVVPEFSCKDDGGPGLASCTGAKTLDTGVFGTFDYTVTATDEAGTTTTKSISYTVVPYFIPKAPKVRPPILSGPYHTTKSGRVSFGLLCPAQVRCVGRLQLLTGRHRTIVASYHYSVGAGHTVQISFRLNKAGRRLLHKGHGKLAVSVTLKPSGAHTHTTKHKLTLRVK